MDKKYTTITITSELSKRIRMMAMRNDMRTQKFLEFLCDSFENKIDKVLLSELEEDLKEINAKSSEKKK